MDLTESQKRKRERQRERESEAFCGSVICCSGRGRSHREGDLGRESRTTQCVSDRQTVKTSLVCVWTQDILNVCVSVCRYPQYHSRRRSSPVCLRENVEWIEGLEQCVCVCVALVWNTKWICNQIWIELRCLRVRDHTCNKHHEQIDTVIIWVCYFCVPLIPLDVLVMCRVRLKMFLWLVMSFQLLKPFCECV